MNKLNSDWYSKDIRRKSFVKFVNEAYYRKCSKFFWKKDLEYGWGDLDLMNRSF